VNRFMPILLPIALSFLPVAVAYPAEATDDSPGPAAARRTLDLRPPNLESLHLQNPPQIVTSADSDEAEAVTLAAAPLLLEESPDTHPSLGGIASLYWAARHPTLAWRVILPVQLADDTDTENRGRAAGRATPETTARQREISAQPAPTMLTHDTGGNGVRRTQSGEAT
jgi:hypothetical protein